MNNTIGAPDSAPCGNGGITTALATLPKDAHLDIEALAKILERHPKTIERAVRRAELPPPIRLLGHRVWLIGTILAHLQARQDAAIKKAAARDRRLGIRAA